MGLTSFHLGSWRWRIAVGALATVCCAMAFAQTRPLNDTGVTFSALATSGHSASCLTTDPAGQDCHFGRDAAFIAGAITKAGGSGAANGFDFTKISHSGNPLPASASLGAGLNDWACTRDNVTGLLWEVKTTSGLRDENHTYTWYRTNSPDGNIGGASGGTCYSAVAAIPKSSCKT